MDEPDHTTDSGRPTTGAEFWDAMLLAAGFDVDPDTELVGPVAEEAPETSNVDDALADPWRDLTIAVPPLTGDQRTYLVEASPAIGAALPSQSLTGAAPFDGIDSVALDAADDDVIDFD